MENSIPKEKKGHGGGGGHHNKSNNEKSNHPADNKLVSVEKLVAVYDDNANSPNNQIRTDNTVMATIAADRLLRDFDNQKFLISIGSTRTMIKHLKVFIDQGDHDIARWLHEIDQVAHDRRIPRSERRKLTSKLHEKIDKKILKHTGQVLAHEEKIRDFENRAREFISSHLSEQLSSTIFKDLLESNRFPKIIVLIQETFLKSDHQAASATQDVLSSLQILPGMSISSHISMIRRLAWAQAVLNGTNTVHEYQIKTHILESLLHSRFHKEVTIIKASAPGHFDTLQPVVRYLERMEYEKMTKVMKSDLLRLRARNEQEKSRGNNKSNRHNGKSNGGDKKVQTHNTVKPKPKGNGSGGQKKGSSKSSGTGDGGKKPKGCFVCGEEGHYARDCDKRVQTHNVELEKKTSRSSDVPASKGETSKMILDNLEAKAAEAEPTSVRDANNREANLVGRGEDHDAEYVAGLVDMPIADINLIVRDREIYMHARRRMDEQDSDVEDYYYGDHLRYRDIVTVVPSTPPVPNNSISSLNAQRGWNERSSNGWTEASRYGRRPSPPPRTARIPHQWEGESFVPPSRVHSSLSTTTTVTCV